jgi:hypothetical protein
MSFKVAFQNQIKKGWICKCGRKNDKEDERCAFCREAKAERVKNTNKFNARKTEYGGKKYDSKKEASYAEILDFRVMAGEVVSWTRQHKIEIKINGKKWRNYYIDYRAVRKDGVIEYTEIKGMETEVWKMKFDALVIMKDQILEKNSELIVIK